MCNHSLTLSEQNTTSDVASRVKGIKGKVDQCSRFLWSQMKEINEQTDKVGMNNDEIIYIIKWMYELINCFFFLDSGTRCIKRKKQRNKQNKMLTDSQ